MARRRVRRIAPVRRSTCHGRRRRWGRAIRSDIGVSARHCRGRASEPLAPRARHIRFRYGRSEEHTSELQSLMRISYAVFCLKKKNNKTQKQNEQNKETLQMTNTSD